MLAIKLQRRGKKHQPSYRLVVQEKRSKLDGDFIDDLGSYDPKSKEAKIKGDRVTHWLRVGAKATPTAHNLLIKNGIVTGEKIRVHKYVVKEKEEPKALLVDKSAEQEETSPIIAETNMEAKTEPAETNEQEPK